MSFSQAQSNGAHACLNIPRHRSGNSAGVRYHPDPLAAPAAVRERWG